MSIQEFYTNKNIFITGGTGFIGKCLIEKLLRSCDGIQKIYLLIRQRKGKTPEERIKRITDDELFNKLKKINPEAFQKLIPINGDVAECELGMSQEDQNIIIENVNIIYHGAASVRFDDFLKDSILINTRGTKEVTELALKVRNLEVLVHISTAYCHIERKHIEEKLYPSQTDWRDAITIAENMDKHTLDILSTKYVEPMPNTYTFTKALAEDIIVDLTKGKIPAVIIRPTVVVCTVEEPEFGWIDNFNGPIGLLSGAGKGVIKAIQANDLCLNLIPVDIFIKMVISCTHKRFLNNDLNETMVYNCAYMDVAFTEINDIGQKLIWDIPYTELVTFPKWTLTKYSYVYYWVFILQQLLPALFIDTFLKLAGMKPILTKIQKKIFIANYALSHFMRNSWTFANEKAIALTFDLSECDKEMFGFERYLKVSYEEKYMFYANGKLGSSKYLFKEEINFQKGHRRMIMYWILDTILNTIFYAVIGWILLAKIDILFYICSIYHNYVGILYE